MLVRLHYPSRRRTCSCYRMQHAMLWRQLRVLRWSEPPQRLQGYCQYLDPTCTSRSRCKGWTLGVARMLHVSPFLIHVVSFPSLTSSFLTSDNAGGRTLPFLAAVSSNTIQSCTSACSDAGYDLAGTEYSAECWCGNSIEAGGAPASASDCNMLCSGNQSQYCGGPNRLNLYKIAPTVASWESLGCYSSVFFFAHVLSPS